MAVEEERIAAAFERAPAIVVDLVRGAPYANSDDVMTRAAALAAQLGEAAQAALLDSHPRLGADRATLSGASAREQQASDETTRRELARLNDEYERRFGFRCVIHVAGRPLASLVPVMRERLQRARGDELRTGIDEFLAIARDRLTGS